MKILKITVGIPAFNEEENIGAIIIKLKKIVDTVIVCDDGSTDMTNEISKKMGALVIEHKENLGYGSSIKSIFEKAKEMDSDILVTFDGDGQHNIDDVKKIVQPILEMNADIVIGSRFLNKDKNVPKYRKLGIKTITKLTNVALEKKLSDSQSGFRAYNKKAINEINPKDSGMGISTEILIKANSKKLEIVEIPITILYNGNTSTHHPVSHGASVVFSTMKFVSIEHPLKFYGISGLVFLIIGSFFSAWTFQIYAETQKIITNITLIGIGCMVIGTILLVTSIILFSIVHLMREKN